MLQFAGSQVESADLNRSTHAARVPKEQLGVHQGYEYLHHRHLANATS